MNEQILTIKEFSKLAGVSVQALYQRLNKSLQGYVVEVDGKKHLKREALSLFDKVEHQEEEKTVEQDSIKETSKVEQGLIDTLQSTITILQEQLKTKDEQIAELNARLKEALELNKGQVLLSVADRQQLAAPQEELEKKQEEKPTFWSRFRHWWE